MSHPILNIAEVELKARPAAFAATGAAAERCESNAAPYRDGE